MGHAGQALQPEERGRDFFIVKADSCRRRDNVSARARSEPAVVLVQVNEDGKHDLALSRDVRAMQTALPQPLVSVARQALNMLGQFKIEQHRDNAPMSTPCAWPIDPYRSIVRDAASTWRADAERSADLAAVPGTGIVRRGVVRAALP